MSLLSIEWSGDEEGQSYAYPDSEASVRIGNPAAENGDEQLPGPLTWMNSASITVNPDEDSVSFVVSIDDPRGGLCFTLRRHPKGELLVHVPELVPDHQRMQHVGLKPIADPLRDAARELLVDLDGLTSEEFAAGADHDARESLRSALWRPNASTWVVVDEKNEPRDFSDPEPEGEAF